jgi:hypothetical protein
MSSGFIWADDVNGVKSWLVTIYWQWFLLSAKKLNTDLRRYQK